MPGGLVRVLVSPRLCSSSVGSVSSLWVLSVWFVRRRRILVVNATRRLVWLPVDGLCGLLASSGLGGDAAMAAMVGSKMLSGKFSCCRMEVAFR